MALLVADVGGLDVLVPVRGEPLLAHAIRGLFDSRCVNRVLVTADSRWSAFESITRAVSGDRCKVLPGGADRAESVRLAFDAVEPSRYDVILIHDAARAFTPPATIRAVAEAVHHGGAAVVPVLPVTDTVKLVGSGDVITGTEDRSRLRTVQTPYGFTEDGLRDACRRGVDPLVTPGGNVRTVAGHPNAIKLNTPFDLAVAEALLLDETSARSDRGTQGDH